MATFARLRLAQLLSLAAVCVFSSHHLAAPSLAWDYEGHYATCAIAQMLLTNATQDVVRDLLPESADGNLASLCSWPDEIRTTYKWSSALHFADTPDYYCNYTYERDCHDTQGIQGRCATGAINNYTSQLASYSSESQQYNLTEALLFLAHFVGDVHQPLHVGFTTDLGGNRIYVYWYGSLFNLHHIWDYEVIAKAVERHYNSSFEGLVEDLGNNITMGQWSEDFSEWESCSDGELACPDVYAEESIELACKWAYKNATAGSYLEDDYFLTRLPIVELRLAQGGVRLAGILNRLFGKAELYTQ